MKNIYVRCKAPFFYLKRFPTICIKKILLPAVLLLFFFAFSNRVYADVSLGTIAMPAANVDQGSNNNIVYIAQMSVTSTPIVVNNIQFTLSGTHDANDLTSVTVYFNPTSPVFTGSTFQGSAVATFAAPHTYSISILRSMAAGSTGYFIILTNVNAAATDNNTIQINGATNPVSFGFTTSPNVTNSQTNSSGVQTIQAADITLTSLAVAAANLNQGTDNNVVYIAQMTVATEPVVVNNIQFTLSGTHDANDLTSVTVYFNPTSPVFAGSTFQGSAVATFAAPHTYSISILRSMAAGSTGYFIILANVNAAATDNNTIQVNGATNPVSFGFTTSPNVTNSQTNISGVQTIQAADITLTSLAVAAANLNQGTDNNVVYIAQMTVATEPVVVNNIQFTLSGTHDANDLTSVTVYFNPTSPVFAGSTFQGSAVATFAAPHTYSISILRSMAAGSTGYFIILANVNAAATDNNTIQVNGATNPVSFGFTTSPNVTNSQTNISGVQTIQAADITISSAAVAAADINQGTDNNVVYIAQMTVATEPAVVNNIQFTLSGTHDANDLTSVTVYFNPTSPVFAGSTFQGSAVATFAAPHTYSISILRSMAAGSTGYFIILANVNAAATDNNTIQVNGATNPVSFGFTTSPNVTNSQTNISGVQTIQAADITLTSLAVAAANLNQGTDNNVLDIVQMTASTESVVVNNIQFTVSGTHDANDLTSVTVYFNPTSPVFTGSTFQGSAVATFAAPHTYSISILRSMAAGSTGYFIILTNVNAAATDNNTIQINGATNPVSFGFTTSPNVTNSQTNSSGVQTIQAADITLSTSPVPTNVFGVGSTNNVVYINQMVVATEPVVVDNIQFTVSGTHDADDLSAVTVYFNPTSPVFAGSTFQGSAVATFSAPHTYSISILRSMAAGSTGYFIILANVNATATIGNTVKINGAANPVVFGFTTSPNITNMQVDNGGLHTLPVSFISVNARAEAAAVQINWSVTNQVNIGKYQIERSADGVDFYVIGEKAAILNTSGIITHEFKDLSPHSGKNFYRITAINKDNRRERSPVVTANIGNIKEHMLLYPNPVSMNINFNIEMQNLPAGVYSIKISDARGRLVTSRTIEHLGGNTVQTITAPGARGIYSVEIQNKERKFIQALLIQ